jgi:hypothetical protein
MHAAVCRYARASALFFKIERSSSPCASRSNPQRVVTCTIAPLNEFHLGSAKRFISSASCVHLRHPLFSKALRISLGAISNSVFEPLARTYTSLAQPAHELVPTRLVAIKG